MIKSSLFPTAIEFVDGKCISAVEEKIAPFLPKDIEAFLYGKCSLRRMKGQERGFGPRSKIPDLIAYTEEIERKTE
jgi:hypothetical protein